MTRPDNSVILAMNACTVHARHLLESAEAVEAIGRHNIAYHLATLALEELGRRQLIAMEASTPSDREIPPWLGKARVDHVKKLFWCFYGLSRIDDVVDQAQFFAMSETASIIHNNRLAGLYVEDDDARISQPAQHISPQQSRILINLARSFLSVVESQSVQLDTNEENVTLQSWFLSAFDDPEKRGRILQQTSFDKLRELKDVGAWTRWLKSGIERHDAEMRAKAEKAIRQGLRPSEEEKDKWQLSLRIETQSHSIRLGPLKKWNEAVRWIRLMPVQGARKKDELLVELTMGSNIPIQDVWNFGLGMARHLILALNLGTSGFWWWVLPRHKSRYYERIRDLENGLELALDRADFNVFHDKRPALNDVHMGSVAQCMSALPGPDNPERASPYHHYLVGLTFISLSDIHMPCEPQAFWHFIQSLRGIMDEAKFVHPAESLDHAINRLLMEKYPALAVDDREALVRLAGKFAGDRPEQTAVKVGDVYLMKLLCETLFRDAIVPAALRTKKNTLAEMGGAD